MSWVTDILLLLNLDEEWRETEDGEVEEVDSVGLNGVNDWLESHHYGHLVNLSSHAFKAGDKAMQSLVYGGAFNFLAEEAFIAVVRAQPWCSPEFVQLLIKSEMEEYYTMYRITAVQGTQSPPTDT